MKTYRLAPMTVDLLVMTVFVLLILPFFVVVSRAAPSPAHEVLLGTSGVLLLLYASVWFWWRPTRFEISPEGLTIVWPLRTFAVPAHSIGGVTIIDRHEFRKRYPRAMRVGAGGLWGGFGLMVSKNGTLKMYISRTDRFVLVERKGERTLMITPERPEEFVTALLALRR